MRRLIFVTGRAIVLGLIVLASVLHAQNKPRSNFKWTPGPTFVLISPSVANKLLVKRVEPKFSYQLLQQSTGGKVELGIRIGPKGRVTEIVPLAGPRELAEEAAAAVLQWWYKPYLVNGEPTLVESRVSFDLTAPKKPLRISDGPKLIESKQPLYPADAHVSGAVVLDVVVGKDGTVQTLKVVRGSPMLVASAINAVKLWKYEPFLLNGKPVEVETQVVVNFHHE